ncbi:hypothetical protein FPQ18DRAFT_307888 [Pyronema domesticum]|nr:hypothetical protein FPQ18DRAFT_307888 [Pyronema domesticum]
MVASGSGAVLRTPFFSVPHVSAQAAQQEEVRPYFVKLPKLPKPPREPCVMLAAPPTRHRIMEKGLPRNECSESFFLLWPDLFIGCVVIALRSVYESYRVEIMVSSRSGGVFIETIKCVIIQW